MPTFSFFSSFYCQTTEIWYELYARVLAKERGVKPESLEKEEVFKHYPIPYALDFRMH